jgi:hypothetical protein
VRKKPSTGLVVILTGVEAKDGKAGLWTLASELSVTLFEQEMLV